MKSHLRCHFLLLVFLFVRAVVLVKASNKPISCGNDANCQALAKLMEAVNEINNKLEEPSSCPDVHVKLDKLAATVHEQHGKQVKDVEKLNVKLVAISTQLEKHSADLLQHDERFKANDVCPDVNDKLDKLLIKQVKDAEELKVNMNRSLSSTSAISVQLEKHSADLLRHDERLKAHDVSQNNIYELVKSIHRPKPRDCSDIRDRGNSVSGEYRVYLGNENTRIEADVYCDFRTVGQSWLVFQRRKDGSVNFERLWKDYATGFGNLNGEFWLGNDKLSLITMNRKYKLRVELEDFTGEKRYAEYSIFSVKPATDKYQLTLGGYSGNAGDSLGYHNGMMFTTKDVDNDRWTGQNSAIAYRGAWWYNFGHQSNLNGRYLRGSHATYADGIEWNAWRGFYYSYKTTEMKIAAI